jgi:hypothetical protein
MEPMSAAISNLVSRARPARFWFDFGKTSEWFVICEALKLKAFEHSKMATLNGPSRLIRLHILKKYKPDSFNEHQVRNRTYMYI